MPRIAKKETLLKKGDEAAGNRKQVNFRLPISMHEQINMMAAERGQDATTVIVDVLERGLMHEAVGNFMILSSKRFKEIQTDNHVISDAMGDFSTQLKLVLNALKLMSGRLDSIEANTKK